MREGIHPQWYPEAEMTCVSCGTVWIVGSTVPSLRLDVCSNCHPFYTGEQRIVDTEGQVERFYKRLKQREEMLATLNKGDEGSLSTDIDIEEVATSINTRYIVILNEAGIFTVQDVLDTFREKGDDGFLSISGIGRKVVADLKRSLRAAGYVLEEKAATEEE
ncbi:MAG: 50S ribosomal protein L31 [Phototrophicales bacterium]|nr:MAG: 50S ribosomal protein L31 [Phototrophicales bacterium]